jgi:hypothetical protein
MGDPLPHDERIGQAIYNYLRTKTVVNTEEEYIRDQSRMADKLFNISDSDLNRLFYEKLWCDKCKEREY